MKTQSPTASPHCLRSRTPALFFSGITLAGMAWISLSTAQAQTVISVNFQGTNPVGLASSDSTGVPAATHWNNAIGINGSGLALQNSVGAPSGVTLTSYANNGAGTGTNVEYTGNDTPQRILFGGAIEASYWYGSARFSLSGLSAFSRYDLVIYYSGIQSWAGGRTGNISIAETPTKHYFQTTGSSGDFTSFTESVSTTPGTFDAGNYVVFRDLTAATASVVMENVSDWVVLAGFQIIGTAGVVSTPFDSWIAANHPNLSDKTSAGNPDGDTLTNLQEYAFGTDPSVANSGSIAYTPGANVGSPGLPAALNLATGEGVDFRAVFGRRKNHLAAGLTYTVQFSAGLDVWVNNDVTPAVLTGENSGEIEAVSVPYPFFIPTASGFKKPTFFRVGVSNN